MSNMIAEMARVISPVYGFIFRSIRMGLLTDTVHVDLTVRTVKGIYMYRKDHTMEATIFTPWSKKEIPFPSFRQKIQAFKDDEKHNMMMP